MERKDLHEALPFLKSADAERQRQFEEYFKSAPRWLADAFQIEELDKGMTFVREEEPADTIYFAGKGRVKATDYRVYGISYDFMETSRLTAFGGMEFIMGLDKYRATLHTVTKCTLVKLPRAKYEKWMYSDIHAMKYEAKRMGEYLLEEGRNGRLFLFMQGADRLALLFVNQYEQYNKNGVLLVRENRQGLADETGLCIKSISRAVKKFSEAGLITKKGNRTLIDRGQYEGLRAMIDKKVDRGN